MRYLERRNIERTLAFGISIFVIIFCFSLVNRTGEAKIITVGQGNDADYDTIQDAVNTSVDGDEIRVWAGTWNERIVVNRTVSLVGNGTRETIIDGGGREGIAVEIVAPGVNISGFGLENVAVGLRVVSNGNTIHDLSITGAKGSWSGDSRSGISLSESHNNIIYRLNISEIYGSWSGLRGIGVLLNKAHNNSFYEIMVQDISGESGEDETGESGGDAFGIFLEDARWNTMENISISRLAGGSGGRGEWWDRSRGGIWGGSGGDAIGVMLEDSENNTILNLSVRELTGGRGGSGGIIFSDVPSYPDGGRGGNAFGFFLTGSDFVTVTDSEFTNFEGGRGGSPGGWDDDERRSRGSSYEDSYGEPGSTDGIHLSDSRSCRLEGSSFSGSLCDLSLYDSTATLIRGNTFSDGSQISLQASWNNNIEDNLLDSGSLHGIRLFDSDGNTISGNTLKGEKGIHLQGSVSNVLTRNGMKEGGIALEGDGLRYWDSHSIDETNTVDGKAVVYYTGAHDETVPANCGQVIIVNSTGIRVEDQTISGSQTGILAYLSSGLKLKNNICGSGLYGIRLLECKDSLLENNTCSLNFGDGISITDSGNISLLDIICSSNTGSGIFVESSQGLSLRRGLFSRNSIEAVAFVRSHDVVLRELEIRKGGILLDPGFSDFYKIGSFDIDDTSTVNEKPLVFLRGQKGGVLPAGAGQIFLLECEDMVVREQDCSEVPTGLVLFNSTDITVLNNSFFGNTRQGIYVHRSHDCRLTNNSCSGSDIGIELYHSDRGYLGWNSCLDNSLGISVWGSQGSVLTRNACQDNENGIILGSSDDLRVSRNTCSDNRENAIAMSYSRGCIISYNDCSQPSGPSSRPWDFNDPGNRGLYLYDTEDCYIHNNTILHNEIGIHLEASSRDWFAGNTISYNYVAVYLYYMTNDTVFRLNTISESSVDDGYNRNRGFGVFTDDYTSQLDFRRNWWGDSSGPNHHGNWNGRGDRIGGGSDVLFEPWLEKPVEWPVANIYEISPRLVLQGDVVHFNGFKSLDWETTSRYVWTSHRDGEFYNGSSMFVEYSGLSNGSHEITLRVQADTGLWSNLTPPETLEINGRPRARIEGIPWEIVTQEQELLFTASGTDDGEVVAYRWNSSLDGELYLGNETSFMSTTLSLGSHDISLQVQDNHGVWSEEVKAILVIHGRPTVSILPLSPNPALSTVEVYFRSDAQDESQELLHLWSSDIVGEFYRGFERNFNLSISTPGLHGITLVVEDEHGVRSEIASTSLQIHTKPTAEIIMANPVNAIEGKSVEFTGGGSDDGDIVQYSWRSSRDGVFYQGAEETIRFSGLSLGGHSIYLKVQDEHEVWSIEIESFVLVHARPEAEMIPLSRESTSEGDPVLFRASITSGTDIQRYVWTSSRDGELYNGSEEEFRTSHLSAGEHTITLRVQDENGSWSEAAASTLSVKEKDSGHTDLLVALSFLLLLLFGLLFTLALWPPRKENKKKKN